VAAPDDDVERLRNHLVGAVQRALRLCNEFALDFPADAPSAVLAALAREQSDVPFTLVHLVEPGSDAAAPRGLAKHLGLPLLERHVIDRDLERSRRLLGRLDLPPTPHLVRFAWAAQEARLQATRLLLPVGAPQAPQTEAPANPAEAAERREEARVAEALGLQLRYPYLDRGVLPFLARLRKAGSEPDNLLRGLLDRLGVPDPSRTRAPVRTQTG
jgi:hypothetical protein